MGAPWVAYIVVGLAISMIGVLGIGLMSLSGENRNSEVSKKGISKDA